MLRSFCARQSVSKLHPDVTLRSASVVLLSCLASACSGDVAGQSPSDDPVGSTVPVVPGSGVTAGPGGSTGDEPSSSMSGATPNGPSPTIAPPTSPTSMQPVTFAPAPGAYRRLTNAAFKNSLRDLLGGPVHVATLEPDSWAVGGLPTVGAAEVSISELGVEQYQTAVEAAVEQAFASEEQRAAISGCLPSGIEDTACFESFVRRFGRRAFRQPLSDAQSSRYVTLASDVAATLDDPIAGMKAATTAFLLSPYFLYRSERGEPGDGEHWRYTSHETAARLAYFLTNSTPDDELLDVADSNGLIAPDAIRTQAERLLDSPAGRESVGNFARELFQLSLVAARAKDPEMYPEYTSELQQAMMAEVPAMFASVVFDERRSALDLFTTRNTFVSPELAALYGVEVPSNADREMIAVTLPEERAGLLGTAAISSIFASQKEGSPTLRGKFVRQVLLCQPMPSPPPDVSTILDEPPAGQVLTKREKLIRHQEQATCAGCHALMDPIGLTLESYDAIGRYRTMDQGRAIDLSGNLDGTDFMGGVELGELLSKKVESARCMLRSIYRYGTGHVESPTEAPVLKELEERFTQSGYDLRELMLDIVTSEGFLYVAQPSG
jgi:hypothetical protein